MASPIFHLIPTGILISIYFLCAVPFMLISKNTLILLLILAFSLLIDIDHLSIRRIKKLLRGERKPIQGWVNWAHTWYFLAGVVMVTFALVVFDEFSVENFLPFISYALHILIDAGNEKNKLYPNSPLPVKLKPIIPKFLRYSYQFH